MCHECVWCRQGPSTEMSLHIYVCVCVCAYVQSLRQTRHGMFFVLPVVLLAARLMANTLFTALCPIWTKSSEGWQVRLYVRGTQSRVWLS